MRDSQVLGRNAELFNRTAMVGVAERFALTMTDGVVFTGTKLTTAYNYMLRSTNHALR